MGHLAREEEATTTFDRHLSRRLMLRSTCSSQTCIKSRALRRSFSSSQIIPRAHPARASLICSRSRRYSSLASDSAHSKPLSASQISSKLQNDGSSSVLHLMTHSSHFDTLREKLFASDAPEIDIGAVVHKQVLDLLSVRTAALICETYIDAERIGARG